MPYSLKVENISFGFDNRYLLEDASFLVESGKTVVITGSGGGGKSILLEICAGLKDPLIGTVFWDNKPLDRFSEHAIVRERKKMGFLFQKHGLISNMNVYDNITFPLLYHKDVSGVEVHHAAESLINRFNLNSVAKLLPEHLSFSQAKLASLARALVVSPRMLFLDQPLNGLDPAAFRLVNSIIDELTEDRSVTILMITHIKKVIMSTDGDTLFIHKGTLERISRKDLLLGVNLNENFKLFLDGAL